APALAALGVWSPAVLHTVALAIAFAMITFLHIVLGELAPKGLAIRRPEEVALVVAPILRVFHRIFYPALWLLKTSSTRLLRLFKLNPPSETDLVHSEEEL